MKTEKLINNLSMELSPVKRNYPTFVTFLFWVFLTSLSLFFFIWSKSNSFEFINIPKYFYELIPVSCTFLLSGILAIHLSVPGNRIKLKVLFLPIICLLLWIILISLRHSSGNSNIILNEYHSCSRDILIMSIPSFSILLFIINKRMPIYKNWTGLFLLAASSSASAFGISFLCPNDIPNHLLIFHVLPVLALSLLGIILSNLIFIDR